MTPLAPDHGGRSARAVIIDDTADLRDLLRMALGRGGIEVVGEAADGLSGIDVVRARKPDLVLLDLSMPVMDGLTALPQIREILPDARIVVLSALDASRLTERALAAGADTYLQKGTSLARILECLREILGHDPHQDLTPDLPPDLLPAPDLVPTTTAPTGGPGPVPRVEQTALELAPFGVIQTETEEPYAVVAVNRAGRDLLGSSVVPGTPLRSVARELASALDDLGSDLGSDPRSDPGAGPGPGADHAARFAARVGRSSVQVSVRRSSDALFFYCDPCSEEVEVMRTAIASTAHEIRGPVSVLCAVAETISEAGEDGAAEVDEEHQQRLMASIVRQARMLDSLTTDLLTAAQIHRGTLRLTVAETDPRAIAEQVVDDRRVGSTVRIETLDERSVLADPMRLGQMIGNLLGNAHKYGRPPVVLRIRPATDPGMLCIDVEDAGDGVPADFRSQLFGEFTRWSGTQAAGTGLGLNVVRNLAQAHGGRIDYLPGASSGSVFTLTLPVAD